MDSENESDASMLESEPSASEEDDFMDEDSEDEDLTSRIKAKAAPKTSKSASGSGAVAKPKIAKTQAIKSKAGTTALASSENVMPTNENTNPNKSKSIEEIYQKKTQLEHILLRPDTYIGSTQSDTADMYVLRDGRIVCQSIQYTPGLFKIFDEIVVNAADNKQRDPNMDKMEIDIDGPKNTISVKNNGKGIPVVLHKEHQVYVPTLIFGHLLTGSNFDDHEKKTTGGRNGYGAKLANVFSSKFIVECVDAEQGVKFRQEFTDNMSKAHDPVIAKCSNAELKAGDYVRITFSPDLKRFGMDELDEDTVALLSKRAYDIAGTMATSGGKKLTVKLNGKDLPIKSFKDYLALFDNLEAPVAYEKTDRWEVGVAPSMDGSPHQVSFVNSICTSKGGGHVNYIADQVATQLVKVLKKKKKKDVKQAQIKNHLTIYVNCLVENPTFDSQTKEFLTSKPKTFGSTCVLSEKFLKQVEKSAIVTTIDSYLSFREREALKRKGGSKKVKLTGITKLDDANFAGTAKSQDCTLIITEGDSAKSLAMAGLSVVGRDYYGVFPLRGKPLNVRDTSLPVVIKNEEIKNLVDIMGLKFGVTYDKDNIKTLRYGHLMIMADQDTDGSHIKGLVINFIHHFWPTLLDVPGFLQQFITPIVKVTKGKKSIAFFSLPEYNAWIESTGNNGKGYKIKYYKGLGTSTSQEAKEYFSALELHEVKFSTLSSDECCLNNVHQPENNDTLTRVTTGSDLIDLVFRKDRVADRKEWLTTFCKDTFLDYRKVSKSGVKYTDFINKEYIIYSNYDNERSIPNLMDGFKPSQRKVLFACFKRKLKNEIKVAQLTGYIAEHSAYHHGEASLQQTIVGLAQNFVGSNNVNLLTPSGQFGTRRMGGKDAASPRYIFTCLEPIARTIFHPDDDDLLTYLNDDGVSIEPEFYVPVIPMVLVNGSDGIGTGYSSAVNNYNPRDLIENLRRKLNGGNFFALKPFYYGFEGDIIPDDKKSGSYKVLGKIERINDTTLVISELPLKKWTQDYKQFLEGMISGGEKTPPEIKDFKENHTECTVRFTIVADKEKLDAFEKDKNGLMGKFKLSGSLSTTNMNLFDTEKRIVKYATTEDIMEDFFRVRLEFYFKRKVMLVEKLERDQRMLSNKARFVEEVCNGLLVVNNRKRKELLAELQERGYETFQNDSTKKSSQSIDPEAESDAEEEQMSDVDSGRGYDYLLGMKIWSLTFEKAEALRAQLAEKTAELEKLNATSPEQLWLNDLDAVDAALDQRDVQFEKAVKDEERAQKKNQKHQTKKGLTRGKKKKNEWHSEMETSDSESEQEDSDGSLKLAAKPVARSTKVLPAKAVPAAKAMIAPPAKSLSAPVDAAVKTNDDPGVLEKELSCDDDDDDDGDVEASLMQRMKKKLVVSPPPKKPRARAKNVKKRPSPKMKEFETDADSELGEMDADQFVLASVTPAKAKAGMTKVTQEVKRARSKPTKAAAAGSQRAAAASKTKKAVQRTTADSDLDFKSDMENIQAQKSAAPTRARRQRVAAKPIVYNVDSDDDESRDGHSESDFE